MAVAASTTAAAIMSGAGPNGAMIFETAAILATALATVRPACKALQTDPVALLRND